MKTRKFFNTGGLTMRRHLLYGFGTPCLMLAAMLALAGTASAQVPATEYTRRVNSIAVLGLGEREGASLSVVWLPRKGPDPQMPPRLVQLVIFDLAGKQLASKQQQLAPFTGAIVDFVPPSTPDVNPSMGTCSSTSSSTTFSPQSRSTTCPRDRRRWRPPLFFLDAPSIRDARRWREGRDGKGDILHFHFFSRSSSRSQARRQTKRSRHARNPRSGAVEGSTIDPSTQAPALAGASGSGFRPTGGLEGATGLPAGAPRSCRRSSNSAATRG